MKDRSIEEEYYVYVEAFLLARKRLKLAKIKRNIMLNASKNGRYL